MKRLYGRLHTLMEIPVRHGLDWSSLDSPEGGIDHSCLRCRYD